MGRTVLETVRIYKNGQVALPAGFQAEKVVVEWTKTELSFRAVMNGELGIRPTRSGSRRSAVLSLQRAFREMGKDPEQVAGSYRPVWSDNRVVIKWRDRHE